MELKTFIASTLTDIAVGVIRANKKIKTATGTTKKYFEMEPYQRDNKQGYVSFDVAVTVTKEGKKGAGGKLKVASMFELGGERVKRTQEEAISRIQFHVLPASEIK